MFIVPTQESVEAMVSRLPPGPFTMLNLYRLREIADYSANPELAPEIPVSGRALFDRYAAGMEPLLARVGAKRVFLADAGTCLIGPPGERWDVMQVVRYPSLDAFLSLSAGDELQAGLPHRIAMLEDSRVIPMVERPLA
ncbi:DUF1330 domain-containing protein [Mycobacterium sp. Y57]|uniref:DUF1330 domain-containing protein n=1 Tax=Mycolicibacterium xanthum TaxID=2796469 RepID=UPI001C84A5D7|nr:DUF1330 domain-containing protein [Mycolicibacterium xanthum]MBX7431604.1 DUF1330 domain-containing protein [Mycolicibacterium xanthum]